MMRHHRFKVRLQKKQIHTLTQKRQRKDVHDNEGNAARPFGMMMGLEGEDLLPGEGAQERESLKQQEIEIQATLDEIKGRLRCMCGISPRVVNQMFGPCCQSLVQAVRRYAKNLFAWGNRLH